jgi:hypothetical protein
MGRKATKGTTKSKTKSAKMPSVKPSKVFLIALGIVAAGGGAYLVYDRVKKKTTNQQTEDTETIIINNNLPSAVSSTSGSIRTLRNDSFPLKHGSRGTRVTQLQQALAKVIGANAMNANGGIDGQFGQGTSNALRIAGYPITIDEATFNKIIDNAGVPANGGLNIRALALQLYRAAQNKTLDVVITILQQLRTVSDYASVNESYKMQGLISKTIVNDLLNYAFSNNDSAKAQIKNEFLRIGLKVDDSGRWSLQGILLYKDLITLRETIVTDALNNRIPVQRNTILGDEIKVANGQTWFRSLDNKILVVPTEDVKYT